MPERAWFGKAETDFFEMEIFQQGGRQLFGECFDKKKLTLGNKFQSMLRDAFIINGILNPIPFRGFADIRGKFKVDGNFLKNFPFPIIDADAAFCFQLLNENFIFHEGSLAFPLTPCPIFVNFGHGTSL